LSCFDFLPHISSCAVSLPFIYSFSFFLHSLLAHFPVPRLSSVYCNLNSAKDSRNLSSCSSLSIFRCFACSAIFYLTARNWSVGGNFILMKLFFSLSTPFLCCRIVQSGHKGAANVSRGHIPFQTRRPWRQMWVFKPVPVQARRSGS
jgi:hypothetical protein